MISWNITRLKVKKEVSDITNILNNFSCENQSIIKIGYMKNNINSSFQRRLEHREKSTIISTGYITHFTPKFESLHSILQTGFRPSVGNGEPLRFKMDYFELRMISNILEEAINTDTEKRNIPMVCFCDIPWRLSKYHRHQYGNYAISLTKSWAKSNFITPISYYFEDTTLHTILFSIQNQYPKLRDALKGKDIPDSATQSLGILDRCISDLFKYTKPYNEGDKKYYDEREWRYIPNTYSDDDNSWQERSYLTFSIEDIHEITVTNSKERSKINSLLKQKFGIEFKKHIKIKN